MKFEKRMRVRSFFVLAIALLGWANALAICDSELDSYVQLQTEACNFWAVRVPASERGAYNCNGYRKLKNETIQSMLKNEMTDEVKRSNVSYYQGKLQEIENSSLERFGSRCSREFDMECRARGKPAKIAEARLDLCIARALLDKSVSGGNQGGQRTQQNFTRGQQNQNTQQETQQAQQQSQQAQQTAQQNQARADQQRQGKRKTNDPAAQAHECIAIDQAGSGNFGAFKNTCAYKVNFTTCNYRPRTTQGGFNWSADFDCEKQQYGLHTPDAGRSVAAHNRNTEMVYWFACKAPATPVDAAFVVGKGIEARCHN